MQEGPSRIPDGGNGGVIWKLGGREGDVDDNGEVCELVEVGDRGEEDGGGRSHRC